MLKSFTLTHHITWLYNNFTEYFLGAHVRRYAFSCCDTICFFWISLRWKKKRLSVPSIKPISTNVYGKFQNIRCTMKKKCIYGIYESAHEKNYNNTYVNSKDSDRSLHPPSMRTVLAYPSLDSLEAVKGTSNQQGLWSICADSQADPNFRWSHQAYCRYSYISREFNVWLMVSVREN